MVKRGELTPEQKQRALKAGGASGLAIAAALCMTASWEGKENDPYFDSVKVKTVCYGETSVEMRHYSDNECILMLDKRERSFQAHVKKTTPGIEKDPYVWAAFTDAAYNLGTGTYDKSSFRRLYLAGHKAEACRAIGQYKYARGRIISGLVLRRNGDKARLGEIELCLTPFP